MHFNQIFRLFFIIAINVAVSEKVDNPYIYGVGFQNDQLEYFGIGVKDPNVATFLRLIATCCNSVFSSMHFVVYRGVHQELNRNLANINSNHQDGESFFVHNHAQFNQAAYDEYLEKIKALKNSGPVKVKTVSKPGRHPVRTVSPYKGTKLQCEDVYASAYDWIVEYYIQEYIDFITDLIDENSGLRQLLANYGLDDIVENFLVSTSLNPKIAAKYASGVMSSEDRRTKPWHDVNGTLQFQNSFLGYVDIFVIPEDELENLGVFSGVEALASNQISLYTGGGRDRHRQEEIVFPFLIPGRFHVHREPLRLQVADFKKITAKSKEERQNKENLEDALTGYIDRLNQIAANYIQANNLQRVFLHDLASHFPIGTYIDPNYAKASSQAVQTQEKNLLTKVRSLGSNNPVIAGFDKCAYKFEIAVQDDALDFTSAYALYNLSQRMPISAKFSLEFNEHFDLLLPVVSGHGIFQVYAEAVGFGTIDVEYFSTNNRSFNAVKNKLYQLHIDKEFIKNFAIIQFSKNYIKNKGKYSQFSQEDKEALNQDIQKCIEWYEQDIIQLSYTLSDDLLKSVLAKIRSRKHKLELAFDIFLPLEQYRALRYSNNLDFFCANDVVYKKLYNSWSIAQKAANTNLAKQRSANSAIFS